LHCRFELISQVISKYVFELLWTAFKVSKDRNLLAQEVQIGIFSDGCFNLLILQSDVDH
jgi:hypothetical protein